MDIILPSCSKNLAKRSRQSALSHPFTIEARAEILNEIIQLHVEGMGQGGEPLPRGGAWGVSVCKAQLSFKGSQGVLGSIQFRA